MQTHKQLKTKTFWEEIGHFDAPTPKKKIFVVAGNYSEYVSYTHKKSKSEAQFHEREYRYVSSVNSIRGLSEIEGVFIGTWKSRSDISEIQDHIKIIKSRVPSKDNV
jgi:hypothetical protein